jgi:hypothetical protein
MEGVFVNHASADSLIVRAIYRWVDVDVLVENSISIVMVNYVIYQLIIIQLEGSEQVGQLTMLALCILYDARTSSWQIDHEINDALRDAICCPGDNKHICQCERTTRT